MSQFEEKDFSEDGFNVKLWKKLAYLFRPYAKVLIYLSLLNIFIAVSDVVIPILNRQAMDVYALGEGSQQELLHFSLLYAGIILATAACHYIFFRIAGKAEMNFSFDLRRRTYQKLQELPLSYYDVTPSGWLLTRVSSDISRLAEIISWSFAEFAWGIPVMIFSTVVMLQTNLQMTAVVLTVVPILAYITFVFQKRILHSYRAVRKENSKLVNSFSEGINGAKVAKTLVLEDAQYEEFQKQTSSMKKVSLKAARLTAVYRPFVNFLSALAISGVLWLGAHLIFKNEISFGTLLLFSSYAQNFFEPLENIAMLMQDIQMAQASGERVIQLLDTVPAIRDREDVIEKYGTLFSPKTDRYERIHGDITFKHVAFHYTPEEPVLQDFNLHVKAGETIALVGETGSGKSTIINLLCRFYEPTGGELLIDGKNIQDRSLGWLHSQLGYVLQAPHLFSGTIADNIRYGKLNATDAEIEAAATLVHADSFIRELQEGYATQVGENGSRLSTGQKQLISFARAVVADPAIFVLDEATASIDTETEAIIQKAVEQLLKGRTSFVVAHRLSTIIHADRILVIQKGRIVEEGNHESLLCQNGYYAQLYHSQFVEDRNRHSFEIAALED